MSINHPDWQTLWAVALSAWALNVSLRPYTMRKSSLAHQAADNCDKKKKNQACDQGENEMINMENTARNIKQGKADISFSFKTFSLK